MEAINPSALYAFQVQITPGDRWVSVEESDDVADMEFAAESPTFPVRPETLARVVRRGYSGDGPVPSWAYSPACSAKVVRTFVAVGGRLEPARSPSIDEGVSRGVGARELPVHAVSLP